MKFDPTCFTGPSWNARPACRHSPLRSAGLLAAAIALSCSAACAQVYSPKVLSSGEPDTTDLKSLTETLYAQARATTDRDRAETLWRYLLTDGRFVKPGVFYHIPGWSYEEPMGEVLDPMKLLNTYGFGLCYQDAPLLQALWEAGGFAHTRVWFLTGHTVAEVFYDGQFHYYDSDMMGYTTVGDSPVASSPVASVQQLERDPKILLGKLATAHSTRPGAVPSPWYNADVRAGEIDGLAELFTTSADNHLYAYTRYPQGHTMDFTLRPGERIVRSSQRSAAAVRYLPYKTDGDQWQEFPKDVGSILLVDAGPRSEKDSRLWSTGFLEYQPPPAAVAAARQGPGTNVYQVASPYVIIDAEFTLAADLVVGQTLELDTSVDEGHTWSSAPSLYGPFHGAWIAHPAVLTRSTHGARSAVAGTYGYRVRLTEIQGADSLAQPIYSDLRLKTTFEFNPRSLPVLRPGDNTLTYQASASWRHELAIHAPAAAAFASAVKDAVWTSTGGQGYWQNNPGHTAELIFPLSALDHGHISGFDAGARFLDLGTGLAPNKLTAETRTVPVWPADPNAPRSATIDWATSPYGPWKPLWSYSSHLTWPDGAPVSRLLRWPEVDRQVRDLPPSATVYVRYRFRNLALDDVRLATEQAPAQTPSPLTITHLWSQDGTEHRETQRIGGKLSETYHVRIAGDQPIEDQTLILAVPAAATTAPLRAASTR